LIVTGAVAALGVTTAALAFIALWEITPLFGGWPGPPWLPLSGYYEWATVEALRPGPGGAVTPAQIAKAEAAVWRELHLSPMASDAWERLAYIQTLKGPHLNALGQEALRKSFIVAPLDPVNCGLRDVLALNAWPDLSPALRKQVVSEILVTWKPPTVAHQEVINEWRNQVRNPSGQFALLLALGAPQP
jgi:hypothetical protein